ncbi:MAG: helix-turn-helix transcriptional regulator [Clostridiales bacterium]|jgi:transcriptional regulator with XRE-family HTH domain|nr:helix-turn-helix transcriptional regulator [Clostridiales bacterium]
MANNKLGETIRNCRNELGLTQQQLSDSLGLKNKSTLGSWEIGKSEPDYEMIGKLCDVFGIDANTFFGWESFDTDEAELSPDALEVARTYEKADLGIKNGVRRFMGLGEVVPAAEEKVTVFRAARGGGDGADPKLTEISRERLDRLKNASDVEEI